MKIIIDSSKRDNIVITLKDGDSILEKVDCYNPTEGVSKILSLRGLKVADIEKFELEGTQGGSFTGLKIGASVVNAFNFANGKIKKDTDIVIPNYGMDPKITISKNSHLPEPPLQ